MALATFKFLICLLILGKHSQAAYNGSCVDYYDCYDDEYMPHKFQITLEDIRNDKCANPHMVPCDILEPPPKPIFSKCGLDDPATFKWSAQLLIKRDPYVMPTYKCGISFIHERVAITTSFCVQEKGEFLVKVGGSMRNITRIYKHPKFNASTFRNDIAVLFLEEPYDKNEVSVVCIPPKEIDLTGYECLMAPKSKSRRSNLEVMTAPLMETEECVRRFGKTAYDIYVSSAEVICVEDVGEKGYCGEDAGGPLLCPVEKFPGLYQQVGLAAWSIGCAENVPRVYVNLMQVRDWIHNVMVENGFIQLADTADVERSYVEPKVE